MMVQNLKGLEGSISTGEEHWIEMSYGCVRENGAHHNAPRRAVHLPVCSCRRHRQ